MENGLKVFKHINYINKNMLSSTQHSEVENGSVRQCNTGFQFGNGKKLTEVKFVF